MSVRRAIVKVWKEHEMTNIMLTERIERRIYFIRGQKVMMDNDLAHLYRVSTKRLNEQVRRNVKRFPGDFMFQLTQQETEILRSQIATSTRRHGGQRYLPYAFTEQGVAMLSSVLNSGRAVAVNIEIMRAFARMRQMMLTHKNLARRVNGLERKYDAQFKVVFDAIRKLMTPSEKPKRRIGFRCGCLKNAGRKGREP